MKHEWTARLPIETSYGIEQRRFFRLVRRLTMRRAAREGGDPRGFATREFYGSMQHTQCVVRARVDRLCWMLGRGV